MKINILEIIKLQLKKIPTDAFDQKNKIILFFFVGLLLVGFSYLKPAIANNSKESFQIDTIIPNGYVLIPIKLLNAQAISSVIGSHGVADIYTTLNHEKSKLLFAKAKIIKSIEGDDSTFSILVRESKARLLSSNETPFFAAVQNPKAKAKDVENQNEPHVQIIYQN